MSPSIRRKQRGQALVEFAIVFPVFLLFLFALIDIGRAVFAYNSITNAAREGARLAIVNQDPASVRARAAGQAATLAVTTTIEFRQPGPNGDAVDNATCSALGIGCIAVVRVSSDWTAITPVIGNLLGPLNLRAESQLPLEFVCPNSSIAGLTTSADCPKQP